MRAIKRKEYILMPKYSKKTKNNGETQKIMMLKGIVDIGEIAYREELQRKKSLGDQANSLIVIITLMITFLAMLLDTLISNIDSKFLLPVIIMLSISIALLFACLICAILVHWRRTYTQFMNANDFFEKVKKNYKKYEDESEFLVDKMNGYADVHKTVKKNNDIRVNLIVASHILIFASIGILFVTSLFFSIFIL